MTGRRDPVLVVEDDGAWADLLSLAFGDVAPGLLVERCPTGGDALDRLASGMTPALVVLDLNLPDLPGTEVLKAIRRVPATARTAVVVLSASLAPGDRRAVEALGATAYWAKPTTFVELCALAQEAIGWARSADGGQPADA